MCTGLPKESQSQFYYWYNSMMSGLGGSATHKMGLEARQDLEDYVSEMLLSNGGTPTYLYDNDGTPISKDIISKLCETKVMAIFLAAKRSRPISLWWSEEEAKPRVAPL